MRKLILYTSLGCHLCEQALAVINPMLGEFDLSLQQQEISDCDDLMDRYGVRIPVVRLESAELDLGWPFDAQDFERYIEAVSWPEPGASN